MPIGAHKNLQIMKVSKVSKSFKGQKLTVYIMTDSEGSIIDMQGWDKRYATTLKEAKQIANGMLESTILDLKYA